MWREGEGAKKNKDKWKKEISKKFKNQDLTPIFEGEMGRGGDGAKKNKAKWKKRNLKKIQQLQPMSPMQHKETEGILF